MPDRNPTTRLVLIAAAVGLLALVTWRVARFLSTEDLRGEPAAVLEGEPGGAREPGPAVVGPPTSPEPGEAGDATAERAGAARHERRFASPAELPEIDPEDAWWVRGTLLSPAGAPPDPSLQVLAISKRVLTRKRPGLFSMLSGSIDLREYAAQEFDPVVNRTWVQPDGTFELAFPRGTRNPHIDVDGRYARLDVPLPVRVGPEPLEIELRATLGAWLHGAIVDPEDTTVPERVYLGGTAWLVPGSGGEDFLRFLDPFRDLQLAALDMEGAFDFRAVDPAVDWTLVVHPPALTTFRQTDLGLSGGRECELEVHPERGAGVTGRVVDRRGEPLAGALLRVETEDAPRLGTDFGLDQLLQRRAVSLPDGSFRIGGLHPGEARLYTEKEGFRKKHHTSLELERGEWLSGIEVELREGHSLAGRVRWPDGSPAVGAEIEATKQSLRDGAPAGPTLTESGVARARGEEVLSAEDGSFAILGLGIGRHVVVARAVGRDPGGSLRSGMAVLGDVRAGTEDLVLTLEHVAVFGGTVVDPEEQPVASFDVAVKRRGFEQSPMSLFLSTQNPNTFEGRDGEFRLLGLPDGEWSLVVTAEGFGSSRSHSFDLPQDHAGPPLRIVLQPAASISGVVQSPDGTPVAGASVHPNRSTLLDLSDALRGAKLLVHAVSGPQGQFRLEGLDAGRIELLADHEMATPSALQEFELAPGEHREGVVFRLRRGGRVAGQVLGRDGTPAARVAVRLDRGSRLSEDLSVETDGGGHFSFEKVPVGSWTVTAFVPRGGGGEDWNLRRESATVEVPEGETVHLTLGGEPLHPVRIRGRVLAGGEPVAARVSFRTSGLLGWSGQSEDASCGADGRFELLLEEPGTYTVEVRPAQGPAGSDSIVVQVPEVEEHELELTLSVGRISGRVFGPEGQALEELAMVLYLDGRNLSEGRGRNPFGSVETDADGSYEFNYLEPGEYSVVAGGTGMGWVFGITGSKYGKQSASGLVLEADQHLSGVDFHLHEAGSISGTVVDTQGLPVQGANIFVRDLNGLPMDPISGSRTDAAGHFDYGGLAAGSYTLSARAKGRASAESGAVSVRSGGEPAEVELVLLDATSLTVVTRDESGDPLAAEVTVSDSLGRPMENLVAMDNMLLLFASVESGPGYRREVGPLAPGTYSVRASAPDGRSAETAVVLAGEKQREVQLTLE